MWSDAARTASAQARNAGGAPQGGAPQGGAQQGVAAQGAAAQASFRTDAAGANRVGANIGGSKAPAGSVSGVSGRAAPAAAPATAPVAAHGSGVAAVARSMGGSASQMDTRPDRTRIDQLKASSTPAAYQTERNSNAIDGASSRASAGSMVGDHTTPPELQKYLD